MDYKNLSKFAAARETTREAIVAHEPEEVSAEQTPNERFDALWETAGEFLGADCEDRGGTAAIIGETESGITVSINVTRTFERAPRGSLRFNRRILTVQCADEEGSIGSEESLSDAHTHFHFEGAGTLKQLALLEGSFAAAQLLQEQPDSVFVPVAFG